jgi:hypothetical protein
MWDFRVWWRRNRLWHFGTKCSVVLLEVTNVPKERRQERPENVGDMFNPKACNHNITTQKTRIKTQICHILMNTFPTSILIISSHIVGPETGSVPSEFRVVTSFQPSALICGKLCSIRPTPQYKVTCTDHDLLLCPYLSFIEFPGHFVFKVLQCMFSSN